MYRNAAAAVAALLLTRDEGDALMPVMPADHVIVGAGDFGEAVARALAAATGGRPVTFGIEPTNAHTGYGYLRKGDPLPELPKCFALDRFVEKPDAATARAWVESGAYPLIGREDLQPRVTGQFRRGDVRHCTPDVGRARQTIGFAPRVAWEDGLRGLLAWCRETTAVDRFARVHGELERHGLLSGAIAPAGAKGSTA